MDESSAAAATAAADVPFKPVVSSWLRPRPVHNAEGDWPLPGCFSAGKAAESESYRLERARRASEVRRSYCSVCTLHIQGDDALSDSESSLSSDSHASFHGEGATGSSGSEAATSASAQKASGLGRRDKPVKGRRQSVDRLEDALEIPLSPMRDSPCAEANEAPSAAAGSAVAAAAYAPQSTLEETQEAASSLRLRIGNVVGLLAKWVGAASVVRGCGLYLCDGMHTLLLLLIRLQRQQLLRYWPDLMERYTHLLSGGQLRSERHSVRTADGHEIHFYRLRGVTRCCCCSNCACATLPFTSKTGDLIEAAQAAAAAARGSMPTSSSSNSSSSSSSGSSSSSLRRDSLKNHAFFFEHGLLESSLNWISGGWLSLPFIVAAQGGEVWLANSRGNEYARQLQPKQPARTSSRANSSSSSSSSSSSGGVTDQEDGEGFDVFTLHAFIAEEQQKLQPRSSGVAQQQQDSHVQDEECCSFFCCRCRGLTSVPAVQGKPPQEQQLLLQQACLKASALLLRSQWTEREAGAAAAGVRAEMQNSQQHQQQRGLLQERMHDAEREAQPEFFCGIEGLSSMAEAEAAAAAAAVAAEAIEETSASAAGSEIMRGGPLSASSQQGQHARELKAPADISCVTGSSICKQPSSGSSMEELQPLLQDKASAAAGTSELLRGDGEADVLSSGSQCTHLESADETVQELNCWAPCLSSSARSSSSSSSSSSRCVPPFEFCKVAAEGRWSFHEMAMYDCAAQLQYIAMNSPVLKRRRAAAAAAAAAASSAAASSSGDSSSSTGCRVKSVFGCGLVAVGQSQGAAQLLALSCACPSLNLLLPRLVLFSPPVVLQPLQQMPRAALLLLRLGLRHPTVLLKALRTAVRLIPGRALALIGNAVVGTGRPGSMRFYSTPLQSQQLALNFAYTPSGGTSRQNFIHWLQQLQGTEPLGTLGELLAQPGTDALRRHGDLLLLGKTHKPQGQQQEQQQQEQGADTAAGQQEQKLSSQPVHGDAVPDGDEGTNLPEVQIPQGRYPLERIRSEVFAYFGSHDNLVAPAASIAYLEGCIPKEKLHVRVMRGFGHLDFGWGRDRAHDLYPELLALVRQCSASPSSACSCMEGGDIPRAFGF
ncbi:hypothetical protein Emag_000143 [Eimeria magna]